MSSKLEELLGSIKPNMTENEVEVLLDKYFPREKFESSGAPRARASSSRARRRLTYGSEDGEDQLIERLDTRTQHEFRVWLEMHHMSLRDFFQYIAIPFIGSMYLTSGNGTPPFNSRLPSQPPNLVMWFVTLVMAITFLDGVNNILSTGSFHIPPADPQTRRREEERRELERIRIEERNRRTEDLRQRSGQPNIRLGEHIPINANRPSSSIVTESRNTFIMRNFWRDDANEHGGTNLLITNRPNITSRVNTIDTGEENGHMAALVMPIIELRPDAPIRCQAIKDDGTRCHNVINIRETNKGGRFMCFCGVHQSWARLGSTKGSVNNWAVDNVGGGISGTSQEPPRSAEQDNNNLKF